MTQELINEILTSIGLENIFQAEEHAVSNDEVIE
jgi:hypothetical protein